MGILLQKGQKQVRIGADIPYDKIEDRYGINPNVIMQYTTAWVHGKFYLFSSNGDVFEMGTKQADIWQRKWKYIRMSADFSMEQRCIKRLDDCDFWNAFWHKKENGMGYKW